MIKDHLIRKNNRALCEGLINCFGNNKRCLWLRLNDSGWYECYTYGFRFKQSGTHGVCTKKKWRIRYDYHMMKLVKNTKWNFCIYRFISPLFVMISVFGIKGILKMTFKGEITI